MRRSAPIMGTDDVQSFVRRYVKSMRDRGQQDGGQRDGIAKESAVAKASYERPYNAQELKKLYSAGLAKRLLRDPVHSWRARTGIELLHREPTKDELVRIIRNWKLMNDRQKKLSDEKSVELFGKGNMDRVDELLSSYEKKAAAKTAGLGILGRVVGWLRAGKAARTAAAAEPVKSLAALRDALKSEMSARRGMQRLEALLPGMESIRASGLRGSAFQAAMREFGASKVDPVVVSTRDAIIRRLREIAKRHSFADDWPGTWARVQRFGIRTAKDNPRGVLDDVSAVLKTPGGRTVDDNLAAAFESGWKYHGVPAFNPAVDNDLLTWLPPVKKASADIPAIYDEVRKAYGDMGYPVSGDKLVVSRQPTYVNGKPVPADVMAPEVSGGNTQNDGTVRINPDYRAVMRHWGVKGPGRDFLRLIIGHELGHHVDRTVLRTRARSAERRRLLGEIARSGFHTVYTDSYGPGTDRRKLDKELLAEYLAKQVSSRLSGGAK